jgi:hypothetical protein
MDTCTIVLVGGTKVDVMGEASQVAGEVVDKLNPHETHAFVLFTDASDGSNVYIFSGSVAAVIDHEA